MAGRIFINYRRGDDPGFTQALLSRLERTFTPDQIFIDIDNIEPGLDFVKVLADQVAKCDVVLTVIGKGWIDARDETDARRLDNPEDFVRIEIESALRQDKRVIPVLVGDAPMPNSKDLPDELKPLARRNAVRLTHERFRADADGLIKALERALEQAEGQRKALEVAAQQAQVQQQEREEATARQKAKQQRLAAERVAAEEAAQLAREAEINRQAEKEEQVRRTADIEAEAARRALPEQPAADAERTETIATIATAADEEERLDIATELSPQIARDDREPSRPPVVAKIGAIKWRSTRKIAIIASIAVALAIVGSLSYFRFNMERSEEYSRRARLAEGLTGLSCQISESLVGKYAGAAVMLMFGTTSNNPSTVYSRISQAGYDVVLNLTDPTYSSIPAILNAHPDVVVLCGSLNDRAIFSLWARQTGVFK
jgi:hypothetical protein